MIIGSTIDDAWRNTIVECYKKGYDYEVKGNIRKDEGGSYIGMIRRQLDSATIRINMPWVRPLAVIPPNPFPPPTSEEKIDLYFTKYLMSDKVEINEDYCYSDDTEVLTDDGWKLFRNLSDTDKVATINPTNKRIEYQLPELHHKHRVHGKMYHIKGRNIDLMVTAKHSLLIADEMSDLFSLSPVEDVINKRKIRMLKSGVWKGKEQKYFTLPEVSYNNSRYKNYGKSRKIDMDTWLKFFGIWLAEGSLRSTFKDLKHYVVVITKYDQQIRDFIVENIKSIFSTVTVTDKDIIISDKQLYCYLEEFKGSYNKYIPKELLNLSSRQLKILFDWMYLGDGNKTDTSKKYSTVSERLADNIQEVCLKIGISADMYFHSNCHRVHLHQENACSPHIEPKKHVSEVEYNSLAYCVRVPKYHTLYVRRNGKACWSGNTYGSYITGTPTQEHNTSKRELKPAVDIAIEMLNKTEGNTNQATISVGGLEAIVMSDPPCLRVVDFKVVKPDKRKVLYLNIFFRSWDLFAGFPENIAGLQLLKEYVLSNLEFECADGPIIAYSSGLHLYSQYWDMVKEMVY